MNISITNQQRARQYVVESPAGEEPRIKDFQQKIRALRHTAAEQTI